jgi:hypothetical protein
VNEHTYSQPFTMHGTIMMLLFATPKFAGFANAVMPLQIGAPDVATRPLRAGRPGAPRHSRRFSQDTSGHSNTVEGRRNFTSLTEITYHGKPRKDDAMTDDDRPTPIEIQRRARDQLGDMTGMTAEAVSSFEKTDGGWSLAIEVLELARVPDTMSLMASYQVDLDDQGQLTGYRRVRRYERGRSDTGRSGGR